MGEVDSLDARVLVAMDIAAARRSRLSGGPAGTRTCCSRGLGCGRVADNFDVITTRVDAVPVLVCQLSHLRLFGDV